MAKSGFERSKTQDLYHALFGVKWALVNIQKLTIIKPLYRVNSNCEKYTRNRFKGSDRISGGLNIETMFDS